MDTGDTRSAIEQLSKELRLTKKQLYFRIKKLVKTGLVKRQNARITTTILGNAVESAMRPVHDAMRIHIQLKAIDTFALSGGNSRREINLLIDAMIEDRPSGG